MRKIIVPIILSLLLVGSFTAFILLDRGGRTPAPTEATDRHSPDLPPPPAPAGVSPGDVISTLETSPTQEEGAPDSPGAPTLSGVITDENSSFIAGARILILPAAQSVSDGWDRESTLRSRLLGRNLQQMGSVLAEGKSNTEGRYTISLARLEPGEFQVLARHASLGTDQISWVHDGGSSELDFLLSSAGTISGRVLDVGGRPLGGASVTAQVESDGNSQGRSGGPDANTGRALADRDITDLGGRFTLHVGEGRFRITAEALDHARKSLEEVPTGREDLELKLKAARKISGRTLDETGAPLPGATLSLLRADRGEDWPAWADARRERSVSSRLLRIIRLPESQAKSDVEGRFQFAGLSEGQFVVRAEHPGRVPADARLSIANDESSSGDPRNSTTLELALVPGKTLEGIITDSSGQPLAGAFVAVAQDESRSRENARRVPASDGDTANVRSSNPISLLRVEAAVESGIDGSFLVSTLEPGTHSLSVQLQGYLPLRLDGLSAGGEGPLRIQLDSGLKLQGVVRSGLDSRPIEGVRVRLELNDDDHREAITDSTGHYSHSGLLPGRIAGAQLVATGFATLFVEDLKLADSPNLQTRDFTLNPASRLSGSVTDRHGLPIAKARVTVIGVAPPVASTTSETSGDSNRIRNPGPPGRRTQPPRSARTDTDGRFVVSGVDASVALMASIEKSGFKRFQSPTFMVPPGTDMDGLRFELEAGGTVKFLLLDANHHPIEGARVSLSPKGDGEQTASPSPQAEQSADARREERRRELQRRMDLRRRAQAQESDKDGHARFAGLEGGTYLVAVSRKGLQSTTTEISIAEEQELGQTLLLLPENEIAGTVTDSNGAPISNASIQAYATNASTAWPRVAEAPDARSGSDGSFRIGQLGDESMTLSIRADGFAPLRLRDIAPNNRVPVVLERLGAISGQVTYAESGAPVPRFQARLKSEGSATGSMGGRDFRDRSGRETKTFEDPTGAFTISGVVAGEHTLIVNVEGGPGAEVRVRVEAGQETSNVSIVLVEGLAVSGRIIDKRSETPIQGARILLLPSPSASSPDTAPGTPSRGQPAISQGIAAVLKSSGGGKGAQAASDETGAFSVSDIEAGNYTLLVQHDEFVPSWMSLEIGEDHVARFVSVSMDRGSSLTGLVTLGEGNPVPGAIVTLKDANGLQKRGQTDATGRYTLLGLLPGSYTLGARIGSNDQTLKGRPARLVVGKDRNEFDYLLIPLE